MTAIHDECPMIDKVNQSHRAIFGENGDNGMSRDVHDLKAYMQQAKEDSKSLKNWLMGIAAGVLLMLIGGMFSIVLFVIKLMPSVPAIHP